MKEWFCGFEKQGLCNGVDSRFVNRSTTAIVVFVTVFLFFNTMPGTTTIKEVCYYGSVLLVFSLWISGKVEVKLKSPLTISLLLYCGWAVCSLFWTLDVGGTLHDIRAHLIKYVVYFFILINFIDSKKKVRDVGVTFLLSALTLSIFLLYKHFFVGGFGVLDKMEGFSSELPVNWIGYTVVVAMAVVFVLIKDCESKWLASLYVMSLILLFFVIFLTQSRAAILSSLLVIIISFCNNKKVSLFFAVLAVIAVFVGPVSGKFDVNKITKDARVSINLTSIEIMKDYPLGVGFGNEIYGKHLDLVKYNRIVRQKFGSKKVIFADPHSILFSVGVRLGYIGLLLFVFVLLKFSHLCFKIFLHGRGSFCQSWALAVFAGFVGFMVIALCEPATSHIPDTVFYTLLALGVCVWKINEDASGEVVEGA